ncbi:MAG: transglutaminase domain-containing protein, partial [Telluria sp.]
PDVVFKRGFGDCKDKATLMVAMLAALGIEAAPALVHTDKLAAGGQATPNAFNHVIVRALVDGKAYWLDPTRPEQQGDLAYLYQPDYGMALVLDSASSTLVDMGTQGKALRAIRSSYDLRGKPEAPVGYVISTTVHGADADRMRARLVTAGSADIEMEYLNYYARTYPGISTAKPMVVKDDLANNTLTMTEHYNIANFWQRKGKRTRLQGFVGAAEIHSRLNAPDVLKRVAPLRREYPEEVEEITEVKVPEGWEHKDETYQVTDPAFDFQHTSVFSANARTIVMTDRYRALADRVQPGAMAVYAGRLRAADDQLGMSVYREDSKARGAINARFDWRAVLAMVLFLAAIMFSLLLHTSPAGHKATDLKLLFGFIGVAIGLLLATLVVAGGGLVLMVVLAALNVLNLVSRKIASGAPVSHWIYPLAHPEVLSTHPRVFNVLTRVLDVLPALLIGTAAVELFRAPPLANHDNDITISAGFGTRAEPCAGASGQSGPRPSWRQRQSGDVARTPGQALECPADGGRRRHRRTGT